LPGDLFQRLLNAMSQLVAFLAHQPGFGARLRQLISEPFDLGRQFANSGIRTATCASKILHLDTQSLESNS
jgi:hypothetical protein